MSNVKKEMLLSELESFGFQKVGDWILSGDDIDFVLSNTSSTKGGGVYAYCENDGGKHLVKYVGLSGNPLHRMFTACKKAHIDYKTHPRVNKHINAALAAKKEVSIHAVAIDDEKQRDEVKNEIKHILKLRGCSHNNVLY